MFRLQSLEHYQRSAVSFCGKGKNDRFSGYAGRNSRQNSVLIRNQPARVPRFSSGFNELDRVLGGGIVPGSAILIGGHPGAGKSTLLLQVMCGLAQHSTALYVTGEESLQQVAMRANRLNLPTDRLHVLSETSVEQICALADQLKPQIIVIDSIQVMHLADIQILPGSVAQVRECAAFLTPLCKNSPCGDRDGWSCDQRPEPLPDRKCWNTIDASVHWAKKQTQVVHLARP